MVAPARHARIPAAFGERREIADHPGEKPAHPDAFALAADADAVHAVVPVAAAHQRQAVHAGCEAGIDRARAVFEQAGGLRRLRGREERIGLSRLQGLAVHERDLRVEDRGIAGGHDVMRGDVRQPQAVIDHARAHALAGWRQPPVLHIAFLELPRRRQQDMPARKIRARDAQRADILQLVAKPVGAAGLVERGACPQAASQHLVRQAAIDQQIDGTMRRFHLQGFTHAVPCLARACQQCVEVHPAITIDQCLRGRTVFALAQQEHEFRDGIGREFDTRDHGAARTFVAAGGDGIGGASDERHRSREFLAPRVAREHRAARRVPWGD